jgi:hypothetical protein
MPGYRLSIKIVQHPLSNWRQPGGEAGGVPNAMDMMVTTSLRVNLAAFIDSMFARTEIKRSGQPLAWRSMGRKKRGPVVP